MKKIIGIGNALVDIIFFLENDNFLEDFSLPKGSMQLVDAETSRNVENAAVALDKHMASGGSASNTVHGLARLGVVTAFIGTVGEDYFGDFFELDMKAGNIIPFLSNSHTSTGRAITLVSKDGERTFATYLGAAIELKAEQLTNEFFSGYDHFHIEGYLVPNQPLVEKALELAEKNNMSISLDLASYNVVESNLDFLIKLCRKYKPLIFANEEEARAFTGHTDPIKALDFMSTLTDIAIVKTGKKGSVISHYDKKYAVEPFHVNCIDTTGAGDLYASGYLYGFLQGFSPDRCGKIGSLLAGKVIEEAGAKICSSSWEFIYETLKKI